MTFYDIVDLFSLILFLFPAVQFQIKEDNANVILRGLFQVRMLLISIAFPKEAILSSVPS